jgi:hypothetical protein
VLIGSRIMAIAMPIAALKSACVFACAVIGIVLRTWF